MQRWRSDAVRNSKQRSVTVALEVRCIDGFRYALEHKRVTTLKAWDSKGLDLSWMKMKWGTNSACADDHILLIDSANPGCMWRYPNA